MESLVQLKHFLELQRSEENVGSNVLIERVIEESDKEAALFVLKESIEKNGRDSIKLLSVTRSKLSQTLFWKGIEYLKQFGVESVNGVGTNISSTSAFANLGELLDYLKD